MLKNYGRKFLSFITYVLLALSLCVQSASPQEPPREAGDNIDWVFVLDTSKSMRSLKQGNIFPKVKEVLKDFVQKAKSGDSIAIYTFDEKPFLIRNVRIATEQDRKELMEGVETLQAEGDWTHTGEAVDQALDRIVSLKNEYKDQNRKSALVLFTDDKEDHNPNGNPSKYLSEIPIEKIKDSTPYTYIVWLKNERPPQDLQKFIDNFDKGRIIQYSTPSEISQLREEINFLLPPRIRMHPLSLDSVTIEPGQDVEGTVYFTSNRKTSLRVSFEGGDNSKIKLVEPSGNITLEADKEIAVPIRVQSDPQIPDGNYSGNIIFTLDEINSQNAQTAQDEQYRKAYPLVFNIKVARIKPINKIIKWLVIALIAFAAIYVVLYFVLGSTHPYTWWRNYSHLEGDLVILAPEAAEGAGTIRLNDKQTSKTRLSDLQTGRLKEFLDGSDAELKTVHANGRKMVSIGSLQGALSVDDGPVASKELYDGDVIEIGDLTLRYNNSLVPRPEVEMEFE